MDEEDRGQPTPEAEAIKADVIRCLERALKQLNQNYREIIRMKHSGLAYKEIADRLGITVNNVGVRLNRAEESLKQAFLRVCPEHYSDGLALA